jgi:CRP-like cAMP-binding protein
MSLSECAVYGRASTSFSLAPAFRGRFCTALSSRHAARMFEKGEVLFDLGDTKRTLFLIRHGVVKTGTTTDLGREIIYDLRKDGDVVGELCAIEDIRRERAVALERTETLSVALEEVLEILAREPTLLREFIGRLCSGTAEAHDQINRMAEDSVMHGVVRVLTHLATKLGRPAGGLVEIAAYVTQEELAQMVVARRERVSTALNSLRRRGLVQYSARGHLLLDIHALGNSN